MNHKNQTKATNQAGIINAALEFRMYRAEADRLKAERAKLLCMCVRKLRGEKASCARFLGVPFRAKWCDVCLSTEDVNTKFREAANKATAWQRSLYHWCDKLKEGR